MSFKEGSIVAEHYELKRQLGQGSFGDVWLAHNLLADIDVAIKFYGTLDSKGLEEFRNEFKVAYKLRHPNLLNINHFDVYDNCPYLVMPYCANGSVTSRIGKMPESEIWKFILDVSGGLTFLHSQQPPIVHQDIKPDNILITSDGRYVISDFGISRSFRTKMSRTNNNISSSGTIAYMGPERFSEKPLVVLASDIWAFGMTLYELMTGDVLWEGMGGCVQLNGARIPNIEGPFSSELINLVTSCLAAETWNRPTAAQINDMATARLQGKPIAPLPIEPQTNQIKPEPSKHYYTNYQPSSPIRNKALEKPAPAPKPSSPVHNSNNNLRNGLIIAAVAFLAIALLSGAVIYFNKQNEDQISKTRQRIDALKSNQETLKPVDKPVDNKPQPLLAPKPITESQKSTPIHTTPKPTKVDDRIIIQPAKTAKTLASPQPSASDASNDDAIFYACQSINDYESYLNSFPHGRHRTAATNAINSLLGRNDNVANENVIAEPVPRHRAGQAPPVHRNAPSPRRSSYNSDYSVSVRGNGMHNSGGMRSGGGMRSSSGGGTRSSSHSSGGGSNRHARSH
jgi:serine/threonine protein kinase